MSDDARDADDGILAATLPDLALLRVFEYVAAENLDDLVSAGQVCSHWRRVAASQQLWRRRRLKCHGMATEAFTRVVSFAPRLHTLDVCWINQICPEDRAIRKRALLASHSKVSLFPARWLQSIFYEYKFLLRTLPWAWCKNIVRP